MHVSARLRVSSLTSTDLEFPVFQVFPIIVFDKGSFTIAQDGLVFIGMGINRVLARSSAIYYPELIKKWEGSPPPEDRLFGAMIDSSALIIGTSWLGWTSQYANIPWYVPAFSTLFFGIGITLIFMSFVVR